MTKIRILLLLTIASLVLLAANTGSATGGDRPRVFVFTDINIEAGDPDDRQSLVHLLWYADELLIEGIVPDRITARGVEACQQAVEAYSADFHNYNFAGKGYPSPDQMQSRIVWQREQVLERFREAATTGTGPLYVLIWGNMRQFGEVLRHCSDLQENLRILTIGTGLMLDRDRQHVSSKNLLPPAEQPNWNGPGRNEIYNDPQFNDLWWVEINWTYNGMFTGDGPKLVFDQLLEFGNMGRHMDEVTRKNGWARYFRVGDTPSVLYLIDPSHDPDDPSTPSWAGRFRRALPDTRPNYFTDDCGPVEWDYLEPANTWKNHEAVFQYSKSTLESERPEMYRSLLDKLEKLYQQP